MSATYDCECDNFEMLEDQDVFAMNEGIPGPGVPAGGSAGQILQKRSQEDYDTEWVTPDGYVPAGGSAGQILKKSSAEDYDTEWDSLDAGDISFDSSLTYEAGTVGEELNAQRNTLNHKADVIYDTASGDIASFPDGADNLPVKDLTVGIEPVQAGTGDPSPTNVRPISGWTGANVNRTGKNLLDKSGATITDGNAVWGGTKTTFSGSFILKAGTYTLSCSHNVDGFYVSDSSLTNIYVAYNRLSTTFTNPKEQALRINFYISSVTQADMESFNYQLELGSTATSYEPYSSTTLPISWQSSAGTVYGGALDVTTGVLTVDRAILEIPAIISNSITASNNEIIWRVYGSKHSGETPSSKPQIANVLSYEYNLASGSSPSKPCFYYKPDKDIRWCVPGITTSEAALQWLSNNGPVYFVYGLDTPITYQLTPTEVNTLLGQNNIWADCGPSTVEYPADTKLYIQKINTPTDDDMIADAQIASGQYFIVNNNLYLSTTTILAGDPIKPGTNCTLTNLAAALNALNS